NNNHTTSTYFNLNNIYRDLDNQWDSNSPFLEHFLPITSSERYIVNKIESKQINSFDLFLKHYWTLNYKNQIDFSFRNNLRFEKINSHEFQETSDNQIIEFTDFNFGNNSDLAFRDTSI